jgi:hypothetical protein
MSICDLDMENPCFSDEHLHIACLCIGKRSNIFVLTKDSKILCNDDKFWYLKIIKAFIKNYSKLTRWEINYNMCI